MATAAEQSLDFRLYERLEKDSTFVLDLPLSQIRLINNASYPWLLVIPRVNDLREIHHLHAGQKQQLWQEIDAVSVALEKMTSADKMNVGALGNLVPQLHIHVIARFENDPAWPAPVWGHPDSKEYTQYQKDHFINELKKALDHGN